MNKALLIICLIVLMAVGSAFTDKEGASNESRQDIAMDLLSETNFNPDFVRVVQDAMSDEVITDFEFELIENYAENLNGKNNK